MAAPHAEGPPPSPSQDGLDPLAITAVPLLDENGRSLAFIVPCEPLQSDPDGYEVGTAPAVKAHGMRTASQRLMADAHRMPLASRRWALTEACRLMRRARQLDSPPTITSRPIGRPRERTAHPRRRRRTTSSRAPDDPGEPAAHEPAIAPAASETTTGAAL